MKPKRGTPFWAELPPGRHIRRIESRGPAFNVTVLRGRDGATVEIKIGDRFAPQTAVWRAGPMRLDVVFGDRATLEARIPPSATLGRR